MFTLCYKPWEVGVTKQCDGKNLQTIFCFTVYIENTEVKDIFCGEAATITLDLWYYDQLENLVNVPRLLTAILDLNPYHYDNPFTKKIKSINTFSSYNYIYIRLICIFKVLSDNWFFFYIYKEFLTALKYKK